MPVEGGQQNIHGAANYSGVLSPSTIDMAKETEGLGFKVVIKKTVKTGGIKTQIKSKISSLPPIGQSHVVKSVDVKVEREPINLKPLLWALSFIAILIIGFLIYSLIRRNMESKLMVRDKNQIPVSVVSPTFDPDATSSWSIYNSQQGYSLKYPRNIILDEHADGSISLSLLGTNSFSISFKKRDLKGRVLKEYVEGRHEVFNEAEAMTIPIQSVVVSGLTGYKIKAEGLGQFTYQYLNVDNNTFLEVIDVVQGKSESQSSREVIDLIISTIKISQDYTSS